MKDVAKCVVCCSREWRFKNQQVFSINRCVVLCHFQPAAEGRNNKNVFNYSDIRQWTVCVINFELRILQLSTEDASKCRKHIVTSLNLYEIFNKWEKQVNMTRKCHIIKDHPLGARELLHFPIILMNRLNATMWAGLYLTVFNQHFCYCKNTKNV